MHSAHIQLLFKVWGWPLTIQVMHESLRRVGFSLNSFINRLLIYISFSYSTNTIHSVTLLLQLFKNSFWGNDHFNKYIFEYTGEKERSKVFGRLRQYLLIPRGREGEKIVEWKYTKYRKKIKKTSQIFLGWLLPNSLKYPFQIWRKWRKNSLFLSQSDKDHFLFCCYGQFLPQYLY